LVYNPKKRNGLINDKMSIIIPTKKLPPSKPSTTPFTNPHSSKEIRSIRINVSILFITLLFDFDECNNASASSLMNILQSVSVSKYGFIEKKATMLDAEYIKAA
jgi:hypothetical protein